MKGWGELFRLLKVPARLIHPVTPGGRHSSVLVSSAGLSDQGPRERRRSQRPHQCHEVEGPVSHLVPIAIGSINRIPCTPLPLGRKTALHSIAFTRLCRAYVSRLLSLWIACSSLGGGYQNGESVGPILQGRQLRPRLGDFPMDVDVMVHGPTESKCSSHS